MIDFFKYLPVSREDEKWGLTVLNVGCTRVKATTDYPLASHPAGYNFNRTGWRILQEYQLIYIIKGQGVFESASCKSTMVKAGTVLFLFPNEKHRYKPDNRTGWDEYWVGLQGSVIDNLLLSGYLKRDSPCIYIGFNEQVLDVYNTIIEHAKLEKPGYQPLIAGATLHLLGICHAIAKQRITGTKEDEGVIEKARLLFRSNISTSYSPEMAAAELNVGYSWFRKLFKLYTGLSPGQYYLQLKIDKAKDLLANSDRSVKEIATDLNFQSSFYFSKIFKDKTGLRPTEYRKETNF
ncbi:AraC family transcriptional regulator [Olivibacter sp. CPCC 100613]|uniref:AraC family transcriptional regulator n=1 Tax=Olivibacter sp. CPCC 100613 TaxID=3079931 RepID=UPI002FFA1519